MLSSDQQALAESFLVPFETVQQLRDWACVFLGIDFPSGNIDPDSNSSPSDWLFEAYTAIKNNEGATKPTFVVYSARECYKTLSCAALEVIVMAHFGLTVAHMAAIEPQSKKAVQYITSFIKKIKPYLEFHGRSIQSQNTRNIAIEDENGEVAYVTIIICTLTGANSEHTNIFVTDEVDVVRFPQAYEEAKLIPGVLRGRLPVSIMTSTRKFAFGLMQKEIDLAKENNHPVLHWNIIDITEKCQPDRHKPKGPKQKRYIARSLPLRNISEVDYNNLLEEKQAEYDSIEAYEGCATCPLLPVCKTRLATRPDQDTGGLYKPIDFTINQFKKINPDMAEAQLMCWKPSSTGLIYPRFDEAVGENTITLETAWVSFTGTEAPDDLSLDDLIDVFHKRGIPFYVGGDWGFRHAFALIACAVLPSGEFWVFETLAISGLEFDDMMKYSKYIRDKYLPKKWFMDTAQPMFIKTFRKNKMPCKDFRKDIMGGIESIRGQVVDSSNVRRLKVIKTDENEFLIKGFRHHHFRLDAAGNITKEPDDEEYADVMDSMRYIGQNLFSSKGSVRSGVSNVVNRPNRHRNANNNNVSKVHSEIMLNKIINLASDGLGQSKGKSDGGGVLWDFSDPFID